jgi:hypothetical protein
MLYNAIATVAGGRINLDDESITDQILDQLAGFHPAIGAAEHGRVEITISYPADTLRQAVTTGLSVIEGAGVPELVALEVLPTDDFDERNGLEVIPELMSVTEIAAEYDISRQAVNKRIAAGWFISARQVGDTWAVARSEVLRKKPRTADDVAAAIARGRSR